MSVFAGENHFDVCYPLAYLVTVTCYGRRLHGYEGGLGTRGFNVCDISQQPLDSSRDRANSRRRCESAYLLDSHRRALVLTSVKKTCAVREWTLLAAHIRASHFHAVLAARARPTVIIRNLKRYASDDLRKAGIDGARRRRWAAGGSCRFLWRPVSVETAAGNVIHMQGPPMHWFRAGAWPESLQAQEALHGTRSRRRCHRRNRSVRMPPV